MPASSIKWKFRFHFCKFWMHEFIHTGDCVMIWLKTLIWIGEMKNSWRVYKISKTVIVSNMKNIYTTWGINVSLMFLFVTKKKKKPAEHIHHITRHLRRFPFFELSQMLLKEMLVLVACTTQLKDCTVTNNMDKIICI